MLQRMPWWVEGNVLVLKQVCQGIHMTRQFPEAMWNPVALWWETQKEGGFKCVRMLICLLPVCLRKCRPSVTCHPQQCCTTQVHDPSRSKRNLQPASRGLAAADQPDHTAREAVRAHASTHPCLQILALAHMFAASSLPSCWRILASACRPTCRTYHRLTVE